MMRWRPLLSSARSARSAGSPRSLSSTFASFTLLAATAVTALAYLPGAAGGQTARPSLGLVASVTTNGVTTSGAPSPRKVAPGQLTTLTAKVKSQADLTGVIDIEIYNAAGEQVYRRYSQNEVMPAGKWVRLTAPWNVTLIGGDYRMDVNVYDSSWTLLSENENAATLRVTSTLTLPPVVNGKDPAGGQPLHVQGNKIVTASGQTFRLLGVNRSGGEFACIQGNGFWSGDTDQASVDALKTWNVHTVRIPLNEECWLGTSNVPAAYAGANYQAAVKAYVDLLLANNITPILEMHWSYGVYTGNSSSCADIHATCQKPMPDAKYAPKFWKQVATMFNDNRVVFEPFNEPFVERAAGSDTWKCWRDGGTCPGIGYKVAGMQTLLNAIRGTGNTNVVTIGGVAYSNDLTGWLAYEPKDKTGNLGASVHIYNYNACKETVCFNNQLAQIAAKVPLTMTEIGQDATDLNFVTTLFPWADAHGVGYLGWTWDTWDSLCLVQDESGTPTVAGANLKAQLLTQ